jgi:hypothetical protein
MSVVAVTAGLNSANVMTGMSSYQNVWSLVNQFQLYQTIILIGVYLPEELIKFWTDLAFSTFNFGFVTSLGAPDPAEILGSEFDFEQEKKMYKRVGVTSSSLFVNETYFVIVFFLIILIDLLLTS